MELQAHPLLDAQSPDLLEIAGARTVGKPVEDMDGLLVLRQPLAERVSGLSSIGVDRDQSEDEHHE